MIDTEYSIESFSITRNISSKNLLYPITQNLLDRMIDSITTHINVIRAGPRRRDGAADELQLQPTGESGQPDRAEHPGFRRDNPQ